MDWNAKSSLLWAWEADFGLSASSRSICAFSGSELGTSGSSKSSIMSRAGDQRLSDEGNLNDQEMSHNWQDTVSVTKERSNDLTVGLKLGKRMYFEDVATENDAKIPSAQLPCETVSAELAKKSRVSHQSVQSVGCQVEGCTDDLVTAKDYHRKHKVCEAHSKWPLVIVAGQEQRFCQQCSRFHALSKFDQKKRSCRRRLSDHNARRRKPQPEIISFSSATLQSSAIANEQQMNFWWCKAPSDYLRDGGDSNWESSCAFKFPRESGPWQKTTKAGGSGRTLNFPKSKLYYSASTHSHQVDRLLPLKSTTAEVISQGSKLSILSSDLDGAPDIRRALSLLSAGSWVSPEHGQTSSHAPPVDPNRTGSAQSMM